MSKSKQTEETDSGPESGQETDPKPEVGHSTDDSETTVKTGEATGESSIEKQLEATREESRKNWDLYLRARADLDNFRKRAQREKEDIVRFGQENLLKELLPVLDNLERALDHARDESGEGEGLLAGVELTLNQFRKTLERVGLEGFEALGEPFDPSRHEAMGQLESSEQPPNTVVQEMQKGYLLNDRLLRPALVMVAKAPAQDEEQKSEKP